MLVLLPGAARAAPGDGWIEGTVSDGGNPIPNAFVIYILNVMGGGYPLGSAFTDSSGYYNLTVTGGLPYLVIAFQGDFYTAMGMASVTAGEASVVDMVLTPIAPVVADVTLHGFVWDELGNPVTVGNVIGYTNDPNATGGGPPYYGNMTVTDSLGEYSLNVIAGSRGGGIGIMNVPGKQFMENSTSNEFVAGQSYWMNISFMASVSTDDAVLSGTVIDANTSLPIENALVGFESRNQWNENGSGYSNFTLTDSSGHYEMNVTNGTANVMFEKVGYTIYRYENVPINHGDSLVLDAQLFQTTATVSGNVTDGGTGLPIANAQIYETDMMGNFTMTYSDLSGHYVLDAFPGIMMAFVAQAENYGPSYVMMNISSGDNIQIDFTLYGANSWLTGTVTDAITGLPIENAGVNVYNFEYNRMAPTNDTGVYNLTNLVEGTYYININAMNYQQFNGMVDVMSGGNVYDAQLVPWMIPQTCMLSGYVTDDLSSDPIAGAKVEIGQGEPNFNDYNSTMTDPSGYYEMWVPPIPLVYVVSATNYTHAEGIVNASMQTSVTLDASLQPDLWSPNMTFDQSPLENISWTNPTHYQITVQDQDPSQLALIQFLYFGSGSGLDNYYVVSIFYDNFNPLQRTMNNMPFSQSGDEYSSDFWWNATTSGGWLESYNDTLYLGSYQQMMGPTQYNAFRAFYTNSSLGSWYTGTAWFDSSTAEFAMFSFDGPSPPVDASDATGMISPSVSEMTVNPDTMQMNWMSNVMMGEWSVVGLKFNANPVVPSGKWLSVFSAGDFAGHGNGTAVLFTVDNEPPVANWGSDRQAIQNITIYLDGGNCSDNVGIVDYAWSFSDNGTYYEIHGAVVTFSFTELGDHNVTLTVTDGAGHVSSTTVVITIVTDPPPVANAGADQLVLPGTVAFDASGSSDVGGGIVNWTWDFVYEGSPVQLWGPIPTFLFEVEGVYDVTLTVTDTAGQNSTDVVQITVSAVIPEFPTLLLPVSGLLLMLVIVRTVKRRRQ